MNETAFIRFAAWSAYFNTFVFILSMVALFIFFTMGLAAAMVFVVLQALLVLGKVRFDQTFSAVLTMTALFGISILAHGLLSRAGNTLPAGLTWVMVIYGIASVVGAIGFQIGGEQRPLAMLGLLLNALSGIVWVLWFGRLLSSSEAITPILSAG
jgi:hypothetical protein